MEPPTEGGSTGRSDGARGSSRVQLALASLPVARARPRGESVRNTASSPPVPLGGHALRAPTASSVVIGRESSSVGSICRIQNQLIPYSGCRRAAQKVAPLRLVASFRFRLSSPRHTLSIPRLFACVFSHIATCRSPHCHCARSLSPARASSRDDDHPVLRGPSGYGGPAGVLRACPHRTRAPHAPPRAHFPFTRARRGEVAPASRPTSVRTPRGRRPHALTRRPRAPLPATTGPTHVQDRPDPDGACATRPDHPSRARPAAETRRDRTRGASLAKTGDFVSLDFRGNPRFSFFSRRRYAARRPRHSRLRAPSARQTRIVRV